MQSTSCVAALRGVDKRYGRIAALDGIDLQVRRGELLALLGPNGAGKSTSIALLLGLIRPDRGRAELFGDDPRHLRARRCIGVMLQSAMLPATLRVGELLRLTARYYPQPRPLADSVALAGIEDLLRRPYGKLSGGQQRRVQFALAVCGRPRLLFLDEPTVGLDIQARQTLWATIRTLVDQGCSVVLTTHYLEEAEALADRVQVMAHGRVIHEGTVEALRDRVAVKQIRCVTTLSSEQLRAWPQIAEVHRHEGRLHIATTDAESVTRRLLAADAGLSGLEVRRAGLAEAFRDITRDAAAPPTHAREVA